MYSDIIVIHLIILKIFLINFINKYPGSYEVFMYYTTKVDFNPIANSIIL